MKFVFFIHLTQEVLLRFVLHLYILRGTDWIFIYCQFNIQQFHVLPTQCTYVFCVDLRTNSCYFCK
jgi:hypothetical protein